MREWLGGFNVVLCVALFVALVWLGRWFVRCERRLSEDVWVRGGGGVCVGVFGVVKALGVFAPPPPLLCFVCIECGEASCGVRVCGVSGSVWMLLWVGLGVDGRGALCMGFLWCGVVCGCSVVEFGRMV